MVEIGGFQPLSLCDFPGTPSAVIFLQGCNWRCTYCHNKSLLPYTTGQLTHEKVFDILQSRTKRLKGIVVSGGEPTIHSDLKEFLHELRQFDLQVKLDTNGSNPNAISDILAENLIDFIAMDIKGPWEKYAAIIQAPCDLTNLQQSVRIIASSGLPHQFRTTFAPDCLCDDDLETIRTILPEGSPHSVQRYIPPVTS